MQELVNKLKTLKNATQSQYNQVINDYAYNEVIKELKEAGITKNDLSESEFNELLEDKIKESKAFSKGAMVAGGVFLFLELLG